MDIACAFYNCVSMHLCVFKTCLSLFFSLQTLLMVVVFTIVAVSQGQRLRNTKLILNTWVSYDFGGKWWGGLGAVLKFKRSTNAVRIKRQHCHKNKIIVLWRLCRNMKDPFTLSMKWVIFIQSCIECEKLSIEFNRLYSFEY